jgi:HSP20 family protein
MAKIQKGKTVSQEIDRTSCVVPAVDVYETEENVYIVFDMPGVPRENTDIHVSGDELEVAGKTEREERKGSVLYSEICRSDYSRTFTLPDIIDKEKIAAKLENGVLTLTLPKVEEVKPKEIPISVEA